MTLVLDRDRFVKSVVFGLAALTLTACASRARFEGIGYDEGWALVLESVRDRADVVQADSRSGVILVHLHQLGPHQPLIDATVQPYETPSSKLVSRHVEITVEEEDEEAISVAVRVETVYRSFFTEFERQREPELQERILSGITHNLIERIERRNLARALSDHRAAHPHGRRGMLLVPAMTFAMGGPYDDAEPVHVVELDAFLIDAHEVTIADYAPFVESGCYDNQAWWSEDGWRWRVDRGIVAPAGWAADPEADPNLPVTGVSWFEAEAYARWAGKRLPTEAEWELCARANLRSRWPWGNFFRPYSNSYEEENHAVVPVGRRAEGVSPLGLHDMAGNAIEWVADRYHPAYYEKSSRHGPTGPESGGYRVLRGGSFESWQLELQTFYRDRSEPGFQHPTFGFRCAADPGTADRPAPPATTRAPADSEDAEDDDPGGEP